MPSPRHTFPPSRRISGRGSFDPIFNARMRESRGPLTLYALPNNLPHPRFGISIGRKVGNAVNRNRIKRLLRESFRLHQHDLPTGYDFIVAVRPHTPFNLDRYQSTLADLMAALHHAWTHRRA